VYTVIK